ncbi:MAG: AMP-binding protein, partial [Deltaproteobacteria bacterium]|nr:AMP-binding protein [Deltaproteobacteria bacterium]
KKPSLGHLTYRNLENAILCAAKTLPDVRDKRVGLLAGNSPLWGIYDIALTLKGAVVVPIPGFFSSSQIGHIINDANLDALVAEKTILDAIGSAQFNPLKIIEAEAHLPSGRLEHADDIAVDARPRRIAKIIYTSGTTGQPKGVVIRLSNIEAVVDSLIERCGIVQNDIHLSLLPLSTLLEAIAGLYVPLTRGASVLYPDAGSIKDIVLKPSMITDIVRSKKPTTLNLVPVLLESLVNSIKTLPSGLGSLRFVACGGAPVSAALLKEAWRTGIPVYQGYGLSEGTSVVTLSAMDSNRIGSVGKALDHARLSITKDNEIVVSGSSVMAGYAGAAALKEDVWHTGDLGYMDDDGYLYITGRKDSVFSTAEGRSISPEWVEKELLTSRAVRQAFVFGEARPYIGALVVPSNEWLKGITQRAGLAGEPRTHVKSPLVRSEMQKELNIVVKGLPNYAAVRAVALVGEPFSIEKGLVTENGRLKRKRIAEAYGQLISSAYEENTKREEIPACQ